MSTHTLPDAGFTQRTGAYLASAAAAARTWYDDAGDWVAASKPAETRERFWICCALYAAGQATLADAVIRKGDTEQFGDIRYNIFDSNIAVALLVAHREKMAPDVRAKLERLTRDCFSFKPGNRQPDYQFHGYNDNMPAKGTMGLILGGELLGCPEAVEYGLWNLRQLRAMLVRNGINSEYNSPTYSPLTIHAMGEITEHAQCAEAREIARGIEARLWLDLAARFHPEMGTLAGPYSRAYTVDTLAHVSCGSSLLWFVLGEQVKAAPMLFFAPPDGLVLHHMGDIPFNITQMCWFAGGAYHVPEAAQAMFAQKAYPFHAVATSEQGDGGADFPARPCRIESVLHPDFTLGTADTTFCGGEQTMSYFATYKRTEHVSSFRDVGTVFNKLVLDDDVPGAVVQPGNYTNAGEEDHLHSFANSITVQAEATALVLTHPHLALGGSDELGILHGSTQREISALSEMVIFPSHFGSADELMVGGQPRVEWSGTVTHGEWIACRRGRLLIALRPLAYSRTLGPAQLTLETHNHYQVLRATFYRGEKRTFTRAELRHVFGGFIAEHAGIEEYPSLSAFAASLAPAQFTDYFWTTRRTRYRRPACTARPALEIETSWSPGSHTPRYAAIDGRRVDMPTVHIDGLADAELPFLQEPFQSVPSFFPWQDFAVAWGDWPYAIGDREE